MLIDVDAPAAPPTQRRSDRTRRQAAEGVPAGDIAAQLGHADGGALALRVYVHPLEENKRRAAAHLDRIIGSRG